MNKQTMQRTGIFIAIVGLAVCTTMLSAHSQVPGRGSRAVQPQSNEPVYKPEVQIEIKERFRYITANGIPDHTTGQFPSRGNPNRIAPQDYHFRVTVDPKPSAVEHSSQVFGVAINGVVFDPGTAELWDGDFRWHYEALTGLLGGQGKLGADANFAHVQPNGAYHYHGLPMGLLKRLDYEHKMALVGYAADGYPIYGPYVYSNASDSKSPLKRVRSGYRIKSSDRPGGDAGPGGACDGSFASDYEFVKNGSDLDEYNGRVGVTPEYPQGTFYYVLTDNWPFVPRKFRGTPDSSFQKGPGGPDRGNPGRPGGFRPRPPMGGPGGPEGRGGPPTGLVPGDYLGEYLGLNGEQKQKLDRLMKTMDALGRANFALPAFRNLRLTSAQIRKIADGARLRDILTDEQRKVLDSNQRPAFGGPGGLQGPGGPPPPPFGPDGE